MSVRRAFKAKVLAYSNQGYMSEIITFGEHDSHKPVDLLDPFACLSFAEQQVRKRTTMLGVEDFEVTMNVLTSNNGLVTEDIIVRPWRYPKSLSIFERTR